MIECKICGRQCKDGVSLAIHVLRAHGMKKEQYVKEYTELNKNCKLCGAPSRFISIVRGYAPLCEHCGRVKSLDAFIVLYGKEEGKQKYDKYIETSTSSLKNLKRKYGEEEGQKIYEKRCKEASFRNSEKGYIARFGEEKGKKLFEENKKKRNRGLKFCIDAYGKEEGTKIHNEWASKCKNNLEAMIRKYGYEEGVKRYEIKIKKQKQSMNRDWLVQKYGQEEGQRRYNKFLKSRSIKWAKGSKESIVIFHKLESLINEYYPNIQKNEIFMGDEDRYEWITYGTDYFYCIDFCIPKYKIAIEYNGIGFHPNPIWKETDVERWNNWKQIFSKTDAETVYRANSKKIEYLKEQGYNTLVIWSDVEPSENVEKCWRFVDEQIKRYL